MSIKSKLILIGICVVIIIVVFTVNVLHKVKDDNQGEVQQETVTEVSISYAEAYRLLSYLEYDKSAREAIPVGITYTDATMSGWYDSYINAAWKMGLVEENISFKPTDVFTYGYCKEMVDKLILKNPDLQEVYQKISFDFLDEDSSIPRNEFLELYEAILAIIPEEDRLSSNETLLVLGREVTEDGKDRMVTDQGKYYYLDAQSYEDFLGQDTQMNSSLVTPQASTDSEDIAQDEDSLGADTGNKDTAAGDNSAGENSDENNTAGNNSAGVNSAENNSPAEEIQTSLIDRYMDLGIRALTCGQELIYIRSVTTEKIVLHNVWIKQGEGILIDTFVNGINKSFTALYKLSNNLEKVIGDITVENKKVVQISVKPDMIQGKVLRTGEDFIEIEGYGEISLEKEYRIYKIYGTMSMEPTGSILVGYETTDFIVSGGKISAALITESIKAENIRVLIKSSEYKSIYHKIVEFTSSEDFTIGTGDTSTSYSAGETVRIKQGDELLETGRITIKTSSGEGKIEMLSLERSYGSPKYRGSVEIAEDENGILVVNELPLEEYLYSVLPSEMPTSYGTEALKVQAVCARSYAYRHLLSNSLSEYGAHVDDSSTYQVYNNFAENEDSILAVKDTYGKVIEYEGEVINAYYFSTSCGHTAEPSNAWSNNVDLPYLQGKLLLAEEEGEGSELESETLKMYTDLSLDKNFRNFLSATNVTTYDSSFNWYRWNVTMSVKDIKKVIDENLAGRYKANPELIQTKTESGEDGEDVFESIPVNTVGTIKDIKVTNRESSGMVSELLIIGSDNTIKVKKEYNIRALLAPHYDTLKRQDESEVDNMGLLPSAFFIIDKKEKSNKLSSITVSGGGYGHGVGLSQNGVKALVDAGQKYDDVLMYFYEDTELGFIYE